MNKKDLSPEQKLARKKRRQFCLLFCTLTLLAYGSWGYYLLMGCKKEIKRLNEDEIQQIKDTYDLVLSDTDEIVSISFMAKGIDTFIVLKIKTDSPADFCADNADAFPEQRKLKTVPFFFSTFSYAPSRTHGAGCIYYSKKYVYISSWCFQNEAVSDLYFDIKAGRQTE